MEAVLIVVGLGVLAFVSTNLDNLGLLVILIAEKTWRPSQINFGYLISLVIVVVLAWVLSTAIELSPDTYMGYLGVLPIALGIYRFTRLYQPIDEEALDRGRAGTWPVVTMMLAQSGDSLIVYVALLADTQEGLEPAFMLTIMAAGALWIVLAQWFGSRRVIAEPLERWGQYLLPFVLIAIGVLILLDTPTDIQ